MPLHRYCSRFLLSLLSLRPLRARSPRATQRAVLKTAVAGLLAVASLAAVAGEALPTSAPPREGQLFFYPNSRAYVRLDLRTGTRTELPISTGIHRPGAFDYWYGSGSGGNGALVRVDRSGSLTYYDAATLRKIGEFDVRPDASQGRKPIFSSGARISPDGRMALGYVRLSRKDQPMLFVMSLGGKMIDTDSPLAYTRSLSDQAADWLPDGRYVYLAGSTLVVAKPGAGIVSRTALRLPANASAGNAELRASPDGRQVLLTLNTDENGTNYRTLHTVALSDGVVRPLTRPAAAVVQRRISMSATGATWSPDGKWVAFLVRGVNPGVPGAFRSCMPVMAVPVGERTWAIDHIADDERLALREPGKNTPLQGCALSELSWLP